MENREFVQPEQELIHEWLVKEVQDVQRKLAYLLTSSCFVGVISSRDCTALKMAWHLLRGVNLSKR